MLTLCSSEQHDATDINTLGTLECDRRWSTGWICAQAFVEQHVGSKYCLPCCTAACSFNLDTNSHIISCMRTATCRATLELSKRHCRLLVSWWHASVPAASNPTIRRVSIPVLTS
jgi:hypothetical protein